MVEKKINNNNDKFDIDYNIIILHIMYIEIIIF